MKNGRWPVAVAGFAIAAAYVAIVMSGAGWQPSALLAVGVDSGLQRQYAERVLGDEIATRPELGHDGRFFFILANDPLLLQPLEHASFLDLPSYRAQRMLYPLLAGGFGLLPAGLTVWGLIVVNLLATGLGTYATAGVARAMGASRWLGLAFIINPGVIADLDIDGGGVVALALGMLGLVFLMQKRGAGAIVALTGAVLARETTLLFVGGIFLWEWFRRRSVRPALLVIPVLVAASWRAYIGTRLSGLETAALASEGFFRSFDVVPLQGLIEASAGWAGDPARLLWIVCLIAILLLFVRRAWQSRSALAWSVWPFALLAVFLSDLVWAEPYDIARAISPIFVAYPLLLFSRNLAPGPA